MFFSQNVGPCHQTREEIRCLRACVLYIMEKLKNSGIDSRTAGTKHGSNSSNEIIQIIDEKDVNINISRRSK